MKVQKDKKSGKRQNSTAGEEDAPKVKKQAKKAKIQNDQAEIHEVPAKKVPEKSLTTLDTNIFQHFKELTNEEEEKRLEAALHLLQHLSKTKDAVKRQKELAYTLKRLIRGCGASTNASRAGFFTGLVAFLKAFSAEKVSMEQIFDTMQQELHVGATIANKEDADAIVGKILVCGALQHAGRTAAANSEHLENITNVLLQASYHRNYHASLAYSFLIELLQTVNQAQFESAVWPLLHKELAKPWPKQTLQTVHCLVATHQRFPAILNAKFLKANCGGAELLNAESYSYLYKLFWAHTNMNVLMHPAVELFGAYIANSAKLSEFWTEVVDPGLQNPTKLLELETLKIATDILNNLNVERTNVLALLSDNFMKMLVEGLKALKQKKEADTLKAFYSDFLDALVSCCGKQTQDIHKVAVIRRLILPPGVFNIEKYTNTRIVHKLINSLGTDGVQEIFQLYKSIFVATLPKNVDNVSENWLNFERLNAGYMLQNLLTHKSMQQAYKWRGEQLLFFLTVGIFHTNDALEICKKESASVFSKDFGEQCKNMFYTSLQGKLLDLQQEQQLLLPLVRYCNERMQQKQAGKYFRLKSYGKVLEKAWAIMYAAVSVDEVQEESTPKAKRKQEKRQKKKIISGKTDKLQLVFHILLLNMGLQLYREPEMAAPAIEDLLKCMQRTKEQQQSKQNAVKNGKETAEEEPEWIEVVVDLFLHLLSQNASALRNIVIALFPHFCGNLNLSTVHQILAMLDMKSGQNPLSAKDEENDDYEEEEEDKLVEAEKKQTSKQLVKKKNDKTTGTKTNETTSGSEEDEGEAGSDEEKNDDDDEDDDDEEDEEDEEEDADEGTATDKLRNVISQVLIESGGADTATDDDMASVDLNDMTEEEGRKLDEALANAFKAIKKTSSSPGQIKKSKSYRVNTTTVMHFRIKVLDLIELYLQQQPTLLISIEIMLSLYDMLQYCVGEELKPLQHKVEKVLVKLTTQKNFAIDADLKEHNLVDFIRLIVEQKPPAVAFDLTNRLRNKCIAFLICCTDKVKGAGNLVLSLCQEYLQDFIKSRNPLVNITLLSDIFKLRWQCVWELAVALAQQGISMQTRTFRRIQIYEILAVLYTNWELQKIDVEGSKNNFKKLEKCISAHINGLATNENVKQSPKEFQTLLELLMHAQKANARLQVISALSTPALQDAVQQIRRHLRLESAQVYHRYCAIHKLPVIRNNELQQSSAQQQNGHDVSPQANTDTEEEDTPAKHIKIMKMVNGAADTSINQAAVQKPIKLAMDARQQKKQKKMRRLEAASKGINVFKVSATTTTAAEESAEE